LVKSIIIEKSYDQLTFCRNGVERLAFGKLIAFLNNQLNEIKTQRDYKNFLKIDDYFEDFIFYINRELEKLNKKDLEELNKKDLEATNDPAPEAKNE
jgi:hypothetical protein